MRRSLWLPAALGFAGAVFALQGIGLLGGSAMTGSTFWAVAGSIMVVIAVALAWRATRSTPRS